MTSAAHSASGERPLTQFFCGLIEQARSATAERPAPLESAIALVALFLGVESELRSPARLSFTTLDRLTIEQRDQLAADLELARQQGWLDLSPELVDALAALLPPRVEEAQAAELAACVDVGVRAARQRGLHGLATWLADRLAVAELSSVLAQLLELEPPGLASGERQGRAWLLESWMMDARLRAARAPVSKSAVVPRASPPNELVRGSGAARAPTRTAAPSAAAPAPRAAPVPPAPSAAPAAPRAAPSPPAAAPSPPATAPSPASPAQTVALRHDEVRFTAYRPRTLVAGVWTTFVAFAHLAEKRADAAPDEPEPIELVRRQALAALGGDFSSVRELAEDAGQPIPFEGQLRFVPRVDGVQFDPPEHTFLWVSEVHRVDFRMRAAQQRSGETVRGALSVFLGSVLIAELTLAIPVVEARAAPPRANDIAIDSARMYRKIFASYSHRDGHVVAMLRAAIRTLGDDYLIDVANLRAGEVWSSALEKLIREADVFQLFWSSNSMRSPHVRREWEYALSLGRPSFVRPTYWEEPLPELPDEDLPPSVLRQLHFQKVDAFVPAASAAPAAAPQDTSASPSPISPAEQAAPASPPISGDLPAVVSAGSSPKRAATLVGAGVSSLVALLAVLFAVVVEPRQPASAPTPTTPAAETPAPTLPESTPEAVSPQPAGPEAAEPEPPAAEAPKPAERPADRYKAKPRPPRPRASESPRRAAPPPLRLPTETLDPWGDPPVPYVAPTTIESDPPGAVVWDVSREQPMGKTPLRIEDARPGRVYRLVLPGYLPERIVGQPGELVRVLLTPRERSKVGSPLEQ